MENIITKELEEKIANAANLDEVIKACKAEGIEITKEQLEVALAQQEAGELDENALDDVAGGLVVVPPFLGPVIIVAVAVAAYKAYKKYK